MTGLVAWALNNGAYWLIWLLARLPWIIVILVVVLIIRAAKKANADIKEEPEQEE